MNADGLNMVSAALYSIIFLGVKIKANNRVN